VDTVTVATIQDMIATGRIVEAKTLLTMGGPSLDAEELRACNLEIEQRQSKAETLIARAEAMEQAGKIEEAKALYESVLDVAVDFPGIREHIRRMDEALLLTRAVQRRSQRIRTSSPPREGSARKRILALLGASLATGLVAVAFFLLLTRPQPPQVSLPEKTAPEELTPIAVQQPVTPPVAPAPASPATTPSETPPEEKPTPPEPVPIAAQQTAISQEAPAPALSVLTLPETPPVPATPPPNEQPQSPPAPLLPSENLATTGTQPLADEATKQHRPDFYTVQPGDSLSLIAVRRFCHEPSWQKIYQLNRDQIADPRRVLPGMALRLTGVESHCPAAPTTQ